MSDWTVPQQQTVALATLLGVTLGALRQSGALSSDTLAQVFALADQLLPPQASPAGPEALAIVRNVAASIAPGDSVEEDGE